MKMELVVGGDSNGGSVSARLGDTVKLQLPENPTTGYLWTVGDVDARILKPIADEFQPGGQATGGGGLRVFSFAASGNGSVTLRCRLARPWEPDRPREVFHLSLTVN
jgi:inhibitor of cysteine peptidase